MNLFNRKTLKRHIKLDPIPGDHLGRVDKMDSPPWSTVIQDHLYVGGDLGTQPDVRRRMGIL